MLVRCRLSGFALPVGWEPCGVPSMSPGWLCASQALQHLVEDGPQHRGDPDIAAPLLASPQASQQLPGMEMLPRPCRVLGVGACAKSQRQDPSPRG